MLHRLWVWLGAFVRPGATLRDVDEELQLHLAREIERNVSRGASPEEARLAATRAFGSAAAHREAARDATGSRVLEHLDQDVRYALRTLRRTPGFTAVVLVSLALGIGANVAIFSAADAMLFRSLAVREPGRLVTIEQRMPAAASRTLRSATTSDFVSCPRSSPG
jgi:hypothetical protein